MREGGHHFSSEVSSLLSKTEPDLWELMVGMPPSRVTPSPALDIQGGIGDPKKVQEVTVLGTVGFAALCWWLISCK